MDVKLDTEIQESPKQIELAQSLAGLKSWELEYTEIVAYQPAAFNDENYTLFKTEIGKILHGVSQMKDNVVNLVASYQDLANEYIQKDLPDTTVNTDQDTLKTLKQQIKKCEEILDTSAKREEVAKGDVRQLKQDIVNLSTTIKQGVGLSATQERTINDLIAAKEQSTKDLETELEKIVTLRTGLVSISENIEGAEVGKRVLEKEISSLKEKNTAKKIEIDNEMRNKTKLEQELREERVVVTIKSQEVVGKQDSVNRATHDITTLENQIRQQKQMIEKLLRDQESLGTRTVKLQQDYDEQMTETTKLLHENEASMAILKQKEAELYHHLSDVKKVLLN